jgi:hypothetical protein
MLFSKITKNVGGLINSDSIPNVDSHLGGTLLWILRYWPYFVRSLMWKVIGTVITWTFGCRRLRFLAGRRFTQRSYI